jgi:GDP-4-dehydro-6-deoxy-D-mannose reductase
LCLPCSGTAESEEVKLRALITGLTGFAGSHLADHLLSQSGWEVCGVGLPSDSPRNIVHLGSRVKLVQADLNDLDTTMQLLRELAPTHVFHLAAQASVGRAWSDPAATLVNNITAQAHLLHGLVELTMSPHVLIVGSADEYGLVAPEDLPINEDTALRPVNPYAVSKIAQDYLGLQYYLSHDLPVVRVRPFNHIGPRQAPGFVVPDFCRQIARIEAGLQKPVMAVGNLDARRAFADVRDVVVAYRLALTNGRPGQVYNIGTTEAVSMRELLDILLAMSTASISVRPDAERMRPSDNPHLACDSSRLLADTGWKPRYTLRESLAAVLDYWRNSVSGD